MSILFLLRQARNSGLVVKCQIIIFASSSFFLCSVHGSTGHFWRIFESVLPLLIIRCLRKQLSSFRISSLLFLCGITHQSGLGLFSGFAIQAGRFSEKYFSSCELQISTTPIGGFHVPSHTSCGKKDFVSWEDLVFGMFQTFHPTLLKKISAILGAAPLLWAWSPEDGHYRGFPAPRLSDPGTPLGSKE